MLCNVAFCKLLGVSEDVSDLTAYHLLRLDPREITPAAVQAAARARRLHLRLELPDPRFIPVVLLLEKEIARAVSILQVPSRLEQYNQELLRQARDKQAQEKHRYLVEDCRKAIGWLVNSAGCIEGSRRADLSKRLRLLGLDDAQIQSIQEQVPTALPAVTGASPAVADFFAHTVDLVLENKVLDPASEQKLLALAGRLDIATQAAQAAIEQRLAAAGAKRGQAEPRPQETSAPAHGAGSHKPEKAEPSAPQAKGKSESPAEPAAAESAGQGKPRGKARLGVALAVGLILLANLGLTAYLYFNPRQSAGPGLIATPPAPAKGTAQPALPPAAVPSIPPAVASPPVAVTPPTPAAADSKLVSDLLAASQEPARAVALLADQTLTKSESALRQVAEMIRTGTPQEAHQARLLVESLTGGTTLSAPLQKALMAALLLSVRQKGGYAKVGPALTMILFLQQEPMVEEVSFADRCQRTWNQSLQTCPANPIQDPERLALAILDGGSIPLCASRTPGEQFAQVLDKLTAQALSSSLSTTAALEKMEEAVRSQSLAPPVRKLVLASCCTMLSKTRDASAALKARDCLAIALELDSGAALRGWDMREPSLREKAAQELRDRLNGKAPATTSPPSTTMPPTPTEVAKPSVGRTHQTPAGLAPASAISSLFGAYSDKSEQLADLAVAALAWRERAECFVAGSRTGVSQNLDRLIHRSSRSSRLAMLADQAEWTPPPAPASGKPSPTASAPAAAEQDPKQILARGSKVLRYQLVETLRQQGTQEAADILLDYLETMARGINRLDTGMMCRALDALKDMKDENTPSRLLDLFELSRNQVLSYKIHTTLISMTKRTYYSDRFPVLHTPSEKTQAIETWKSYIESHRGSSRVTRPDRTDKTRKIDRTMPPPKATAPEQASPGPAGLQVPAKDVLAVKMLALSVRDLTASAQGLQAFQWGRGHVSINQAPQAVKANPGEAHLAAAYASNVEQLERLAREHPAGKKWAGQIDGVLSLLRQRLLACEGELQAAAMQAHAAGQLLEILVLAGAKGGNAAVELAEIAQQRSEQLAKATTVLEELRDATFYNLLLWDLLVQAQAAGDKP